MEGFVHFVARPEEPSEQLFGFERPAARAAPPEKHVNGSDGRRGRAHLAPWQIKLAREMMNSDLPERVMLADIAARLEMSVNHFIRAFRESEGISPYQWYMQRRIVRAMKLLHEDAVPLAKVATACGFADQSHFTKAFTRALGVSPGRWRRNLKKPQPPSG